MNVLITGGLGFLGKYLSKQLVDRGYSVILFDVGAGIMEVPGKVEKVHGDISLWPDVLHTIQKFRVDCVFHLAALTSAAAEINPMAALRVNVEGTANLLEAIHLLGVRKIIFPSSVAVYGPRLPEPVVEDVNLAPRSAYGASKVFGELWGLWYHHRHGIDFRTLRFPSILGPGRSLRAASAYSALIIEKAAKGEPYTIPVEEDTRMPILHYEDAVRALMLLFEAEDPPSRIYNIAGISPSAREIVNEVKSHVPGAVLNFEPDPQINAIIRNWPSSLDDRKARGELYWRPCFDLETMIGDLLVKCGSFYE